MRGETLSVLVLIASLSGAARAEREYEYGMALYKKFRFEDLAEKFFTELKEKGSRSDRLSGVFGLGGIKEEQAKAAERAKRPAEAQRLFKKARELYQQVLDQAPDNWPPRRITIDAMSELKKKEAQNKVKEAPAEKDKKKKARLLREAREILEDLVKPLVERARKAKKRYEKDVKDTPEPRRTEDKKRRAKLLNEAVVAFQRLYLMQSELADVYEKGSKARKKFLSRMVKDVTEQIEYWESEEYVGVVMWLNHMLGRVHALAGNQKEAYKKGFDPIIEENPQLYPAGGPREFVDDLRMVSFYLKARTAFDAGDWDTVVKTVDQLFMPAIGPGGGYPDALSDDRGNGAMMFRAKAHVRRKEPDYAAAIQDCLRVINAAHEPWPNNGRQLLARIQDTMPEDEAVALGPKVLHSMAFGHLQLALQESGQKKRTEACERAVSGYEKTVVACRDEETGYRLRLRHEPTAWFELGICYSKLNLWYEAGFAFEAVLRFFAKDKIGREIKDWPEFAGKLKEIRAAPKRAEGEVEDPHVKLFEFAAKDSSIKALLEVIDDRLKKSANNLMVSAGRRRRESNWSFDQARYSQAIDILLQVDPEKRKQLDFHRAVTKRSEAETLSAQKRRVPAAKAWLEAAELFLKAAQRIRGKRETSYYLAGEAYYRAMTEAEKVTRRAPELAKEAPEYARNALAAFASFKRDAAADRRVVDKEVLEQRLERMGKADLVIPSIYLSLGENERTVEAADDYLAREGTNPEYMPKVIWTRFKALKRIAEKSLGTEKEAASLEALSGATNDIKTGPADRFYRRACTIMSSIYTQLATRLAEKAKAEGGAELTKRAERYRLESAKWMKQVIEMTPEDERDLGFMATIAQEFYKQNAHVRAREMYLEILSTHDPDRDGIKEELTKAVFAATKKSAIFDKDYLIKKVRADIDTLKVLVLGEPESERIDARTKKPGPPRKRNWRVAAKAIDKLFEYYPMVKGKKELTSLLRRIRDELKFRLQILAVRLNLSDCSRALGRQLQETNPEGAKKYWEEAIENIKKVREYHWRDNELRVLQAESHQALGQLEEARKLYYEAAEITKEGTPEWYAANRAYSDIAFGMGHYRAAMYFADVVVRTVPEEEWKQHFPDVKEHIAKCEKAIEAAGEKVVMQEITDAREISYDPPSDADLQLLRQFKGIEHRIEQKKLKEEDRKKEQIRAVERHFKNRAREAYNRPKTWATMTPPQIKKSEVDPNRKILLARQLYQSPIQQEKLRKMVVNLGVLEDMSDGMSPDLLAEHIRKKAIELGLLTKDGEKKPKSEIPKELLGKEDIYDVGAPSVKPPAEAPPGEVAEEAEAPAEGAAEEPVAEEPAAEEAAPEEPPAEAPAEAREGAAP